MIEPRRLPAFNVLTLAVAAIALCLSVAHALSSETLSDSAAFVRIDRVLADYKGTAELRSTMEVKKAHWQQELDTLEADYKATLATINRDWGALPTVERQRLEDLLSHQHSNLARQTSTANERMKEHETTAMTGLMNQINEVLATYAREHGIDVVFGVNGDGALLYGSDALDITGEITTALNRTYAVASRRSGGN